VLLVVGAPNSSNSQRLVEVAALNGCPRAVLVQRATEIDWAQIEGARTVGITAGASAPDVLVRDVIDAIRARFDVTVEDIGTVREDVVFSLPKALVG
jgi:4-hydroxy-3-methylbut-2-enyl diphosphate reductase